MRLRMLVCMALFTTQLAGCLYYQEYRQMKGDADILKERASLLKAQRQCVREYEADAQAAKEHCGIYLEMIKVLDAGSSSLRTN